MQQPLKLDAFIKWEALPSLPLQLTKIIDQVGTASSMDYDIVGKIKYDASIACRILKQANSALYGYAGKISSLQQACGLLGLEMVKNIVFTTPATEFFQDKTIDPHLFYSDLWRSLAISGVISEWLGGQKNDLDSDECFSAGLIQGIGKIALAVSQPALLQECHQISVQENISLEDAEQRNFGFSHWDVGLKLATAWGYPSSLINLFKNQNKRPTTEVCKLSDTIQLAKFITDKLGYHDGLGSPAGDTPLTVWSGAGFNEDELSKSWPLLKELAQNVERRFVE
jgi:HD-like signal output (HDOD) protein